MTRSWYPQIYDRLVDFSFREGIKKIMINMMSWWLLELATIRLQKFHKLHIAWDQEVRYFIGLEFARQIPNLPGQIRIPENIEINV
jgi:hypothetical protein